jgi:phage tail-like protein
VTRAGVVESPADPGFVLRNPHPIGETFPGVYRDAWHDEELRTGRSPFGPRFVSAFDDVLSPILATLDNLDAYFDVDTTPEDFLPWLGQWVGASIDESWSK